VTDEIKLVMPAQEDFRHIAQLVAGGLGARLDLTYEDLDDLQTALDALLACRDDDGDIEVLVEVGESAIRATVGPFGDDQLQDLEAESESLGLRRVLETVASAFEVERRGSSAWVVLTKTIAAAAAEAAG
jgi:anti-sigma regulatory factor (Ser/Thr protein kinase)